MRPQRQSTKDIDYCKLAGMSHKSRTKSKGSVRSERTAKSEKSEQAEVEGMEFKNLKEVILKEAEEGMGDSITDQPVPADIENKEVFNATVQAHEEEHLQLEQKRLQLNRCQKALDIRKQLSNEKRELEALAWSQKLQLKEMEIEEKAVCLELMEKEEKLKTQDQEINRRARYFREREGALLEAGIKSATQGKQVDTTSNADQQRCGTTTSRPPVGRARSIEGVHVAPSDDAGEVDREKYIKNLEQELLRLRGVDARGAPVSGPTAVKQLKDIGLMPVHVDDEMMSLPRQGANLTADEIKKTGLQMLDTGKTELTYLPQLCSGCSTGDKGKLKSGKFAKTNINIKIQEQWSHMNVMRKYTRCTTFD